MATSKKLPLNYIVFDDEDGELEQNQINVKVPGIECNLIFINPVEYWDVETDEFRMDDFSQKIDEEIKGKQINLIASDWNMVPKTTNHKEINALEIVKLLVNKHDKFKKIQYLIYSGKSKEVSEVLVSEIKDEIENTEGELISSKQLLSMLLELKIKFCARNERFNEINTLITNSKTISLVVLNALSNFDRNVIHNTGNDHFDGREIGVLIDLISQDDNLGLKFIREIIELSIAHYSRLNE